MTLGASPLVIVCEEEAGDVEARLPPHHVEVGAELHAVLLHHQATVYRQSPAPGAGDGRIRLRGLLNKPENRTEWQTIHLCKKELLLMKRTNFTSRSWLYFVYERIVSNLHKFYNLQDRKTLIGVKAGAVGNISGNCYQSDTEQSKQGGAGESPRVAELSWAAAGWIALVVIHYCCQLSCPSPLHKHTKRPQDAAGYSAGQTGAHHDTPRLSRNSSMNL